MSSASAFISPNYRFDAIVALVALGAGLLLPSSWLLFSFMVTGFAHFFIASLYQYRAGKMTNRYLAFAGVLVLALLTYLYFLGEYGVWMFLFVAFLVPVHFALDEVTLHGECLNPHKISTVVAFTALAFLMVVREFIPGGFSSIAYDLSVLAFLCGITARLLFNRTGIGRSEYFVWAVGLVIIIMAAAGRARDVLAVIILLHVFDWGVGYARRLARNPERLRPYLRLTLLANLGALAAAIVFFAFKVEPLRYFFFLFYYDAWASAHILLSFRVFGQRPALPARA